MFRKKPGLGTQSTLGNKDRKRLRDQARKLFPLLTDAQFDLLLPPKDETAIVAKLQLPQPTAAVANNNNTSGIASAAATDGGNYFSSREKGRAGSGNAGSQKPAQQSICTLQKHNPNRAVEGYRFDGGAAAVLLGPLLNATGSNKAAVYFCKNQPVFFEINGLLIPSLYTTWLLPDILPVFVIHPSVSSFVLRGADLMLPGVVWPLTLLQAQHQQQQLQQQQQQQQQQQPGAAIEAPLQDRSNLPVTIGQLWAIRSAGNKFPFALGRVAVGAPSLQQLSLGGKGKAVEVIHYYGDGLWQLGSQTCPNSYFSLKEVQGDQSSEESATASACCVPLKSSKNTNKNGETPAAANQCEVDALHAVAPLTTDDGWGTFASSAAATTAAAVSIEIAATAQVETGAAAAEGGEEELDFLCSEKDLKEEEEEEEEGGEPQGQTEQQRLLEGRACNANTSTTNIRSSSRSSDSHSHTGGGEDDFMLKTGHQSTAETAGSGFIVSAAGASSDFESDSPVAVAQALDVTNGVEVKITEKDETALPVITSVAVAPAAAVASMPFEEMDEYLRLCVLEVLHGLSDEQLPMDISAIYSKIVAEAPAVFLEKLPAATGCATTASGFVPPDIRKSSYKKLTKFFQCLVREGVLKTKESRSVTSAVKVHRSAKALETYQPLSEKQKRKAQAAVAAALALPGPVQQQQQHHHHHHQQKPISCTEKGVQPAADAVTLSPSSSTSEQNAQQPGAQKNEQLQQLLNNTGRSAPFLDVLAASSSLQPSVGGGGRSTSTSRNASHVQKKGESNFATPVSTDGPAAIELFGVPTRLLTVFHALKLYPTKETFFTAQEVKEVLARYIGLLEAEEVEAAGSQDCKRENEWTAEADEQPQKLQAAEKHSKGSSSKRDGTVLLDDVLKKALLTKEEASGEGPQRKRKDELFTRWKHLMLPHHAVIPANTVNIDYSSLKIHKGPLLPVKITVEDRAGGRKHVTHIVGLQAFLLDPKVVAEYLQKKLACAATTYALPGQKEVTAVSVQGSMVNAVADALCSHFKLHKRFIDAEQKKVAVATKVTRK